jgi:AcrR family transcriptional regulator
LNSTVKTAASGGIKVLAKALGVTKGGFYWHFKDRRDLLAAILEDWRLGRIAAIEKQTQSAGRNARERLMGLVRLYSEAVNPQGMAIELAIRQWARHDSHAAEAARSVDVARLRSISSLYEELGQDRRQAEQRALLFYSFVFGQSLLFLEKSSRSARADRSLRRAPRRTRRLIRPPGHRQYAGNKKPIRGERPPCA